MNKTLTESEISIVISIFKEALPDDYEVLGSTLSRHIVNGGVFVPPPEGEYLDFGDNDLAIEFIRFMCEVIKALRAVRLKRSTGETEQIIRKIIREEITEEKHKVKELIEERKENELEAIIISHYEGKKED